MSDHVIAITAHRVITRCESCNFTYAHMCPGDEEKKVLETITFIRKPLIVEGVQVEDHNILEIANWCGGEVTSTPSHRSFIKLQTKPSPMTRQHMAFVGDWVLKSEVGFKIYSKRAFERTFDTYRG